jgi:outer membrane protein TolC
MRGTAFPWRFAYRFVGTLVAPVVLSLTGGAFAADFAAEPLPPPGSEVAPAPAPQILDLHQCRELARAQQPAIAAARASLSAAVEKQQALDKLRFAAVIQRDLPARRKQAAVGVQAAEALVSVAEADTIYGVTFSYLSTLYANEQLRVADEAIEDLKRLLESVQKSVESGDARREIGKTQVDLIKTYLYAAQARREEAVEGLQRAASALREAMGVGPDCPVTLAQSTLSDVSAMPDKEQILGLALARRGEMAQADAAFKATCFEIEAQRSTFFFSGRTFAMASDIHANPLPAAEHDDRYRPGAVDIEMPPMLPGMRADRVHQAEAYHQRAGAVVDKTRNLITLDAEQTYLRWLEAAKQLPHLREAAATSDRAAAGLRTNFNPGAGGKGTVEEVLNAGLLASNQKLHLNQARYQALIGLAGLERATAGGFCAGFEAPR